MEFKKVPPSRRKKPDKKRPLNRKVNKTGEVRVNLTKTQKANDFKSKGLTLIKGKKKKYLNLKFVFTAVIGLLLIVFLVVLLSAPTGIVEFVETKVALSKSGNTFPIQYDFSTPKGIDYKNGTFLVATETELKCFNKSGNEIYSRIHGFEKPIIKSSAIRTLVYGLNESFYRIETPYEEVIYKKTESNHPIIAGDISDSGVYALVTESNEDIALVTVYNKDGSEIYKYHSSNNYATGVTVSADGKRVCIATLTTYEAEFVSKIIVLSLDSEKPLLEKELKGEVVYSVEYTDSSDICIITDKNYINIDDDEITSTYSYNNEFLNKFEISSDYVLLYITADSNSSEGTVAVFSETGDKEAEFVVDGVLSDISICKNKIFALNEKITEYNLDGEAVKSTEIRSGAVRIKAIPKGCAVLYSSGVDLVE